MGSGMSLPPKIGTYEETVGPPNERGPLREEVSALHASQLDLRSVGLTERPAPAPRGSSWADGVVAERT